jgi:hypothetical protein
MPTLALLKETPQPTRNALQTQKTKHKRPQTPLIEEE